MGYVVVERYMNKSDIYGLRECAIVDSSLISDLSGPLGYVRDSLSCAASLAKKAKDQDLLSQIVADQFIWRKTLEAMTSATKASREAMPGGSDDMAVSLDADTIHWTLTFSMLVMTINTM